MQTETSHSLCNIHINIGTAGCHFRFIVCLFACCVRI